MIDSHYILALQTNSSTWAGIKDQIAETVDACGSNGVALELNLYAFNAVGEAYWLLHDLAAYLQRAGIPFLLVPVSTPILAGVSAEGARKLVDLGIEVSNRAPETR